MIDIHHQLAGPDGAALVVRVPRELSHDSAEPLRSTVMRHLPNREGAGLVLDMADVGLISSIGIAALLQVQEFCRDRRAPCILASLPARQIAFLRMLKLDRKFDLSPDVEAGVTRVCA